MTGLYLIVSWVGTIYKQRRALRGNYPNEAEYPYCSKNFKSQRRESQRVVYHHVYGVRNFVEYKPLSTIHS